MVTAFFISLILLFLGIAVLVLIHVCIVGRSLRRGNEEQSDGEIVRNRVCEGDEVKRLPCFNYKEAEKGGGSTVDCAVCLDSFKVGDMCRFLPNCSHSFHVPCIDSWILKTPVCPICRTWVHSPMIPMAVGEDIDASDSAAIETV